jgi:hypothetical protein
VGLCRPEATTPDSGPEFAALAVRARSVIIVCDNPDRLAALDEFGQETQPGAA